VNDDDQAVDLKCSEGDGVAWSETLVRRTSAQWVERKVAQGWPWYKGMPYLCAALARHVYHCLKFRDPYTVEKAFSVARVGAGSQASWSLSCPTRACI
jgi:hypothetical protein